VLRGSKKQKGVAGTKGIGLEIVAKGRAKRTLPGGTNKRGKGGERKILTNVGKTQGK